MKKQIELVIVTALSVLVMASSAQDKPAFPERPAQETGPSVEQLDEKIAELQRQVEALEQKKAETERLADLQAQLTDLHNESKERIKDMEAQLANMETEEKPVTPAQHALCDGRKKFLEGAKGLSVKILGIKDPKALEQARQVREEIENLQTAWDVVEEPKLSAARTIEELTKDLEQDGNQYRREILEKLCQLAAQDAEGRSQEMAIISARREREKVRDKLVKDFYKDQ